MSEEIEKVKCLIIGSGPAGYTAAIYAARANMAPVLYQGLQPGGQLTTTTDVDNFPGYPEGVNGTEMMMQLEAQAKRFDADIRFGLVTKVDLTGSVHKAWVDNEKEIHADTIIISTGASARYLGLESEQYYLKNGGGVSACAVCDGFFYRNQDVVIVGAGDSACEEASYLANICNKVTMLIRKDHFKASKIMEQRVLNNDKIEVRYNTEIDEVLGDGKVVTGCRIKNNKTGETEELAVTGVFIAIGHTPNTELFKDYVELEDNGYIKNVPGTAKTNVEGVFVAGDAADHVYKQAITAAGTGCMAALDAERYLTNKGLH